MSIDTSENKSIATDPRLINAYYDHDDEIDLFELFSNLWKEKLLIVLVACTVVIFGGLYAFLSTPVYESKLYLLPPTEKNTVELKKLMLLTNSNSNSTAYSVTSVYTTFIEILKSNSAKRSFFQQPDIYDYYTSNGTSEINAWKNYLNALSVNIPKKAKVITSINVSLNTDSALTSQQWLNDYIDHVITLSKQQLLSDLNEQLTSQKQQIELQIASRINLYSSSIEKELAKLKEALSIANSLKLTDPMNMDSIDNEKNDLMVDEVRRLYKLGSHALTAEITALQNRKDNDLFIPGLSDLLQQQALLLSFTINERNISPAQIDLAAQLSDKPIKPKKLLIIAISLVLGLMLGVFAAIIRSFINSRKEADS